MNNLETMKGRVAKTLALQKAYTADPHYVFCAKSTPYSVSDSVVPSPTESEILLPTSIYNDMIFGKKIQSTDIMPMIKKNIWASNTLYSQYSSEDTAMQTESFFVTVASGSYYHTYKCLSNGRGAYSNVQPSGTSLSIFENLGDGYVWKYVATIDNTTFNKFSTDKYHPVQANTSVQTAAVQGSIDVVHINTLGSVYPNFYLGFFGTTDIAIGGSSIIFKLPNSVSNFSNYYTNCIIKMTSGAAAGQYKKIISYNGSTNQIIIESAFSVTPSNLDTYEIYPSVIFAGDGIESTPAVARAIVNSLGILQKVEILNPGAGYRVCNALIYADTSVNVITPASISPVISPGLGHGANPAIELGACYLGISVTFNQSESNNVTSQNDYRIIGIIKKPEYQNVNIILDQTGQIGTFIVGDTVKQYSGIKISNTVTVTSGSTIISSANTEFLECLSVNKEVILSDGTQNFYSRILAVSNNSIAQLQTTPPWSNTNCILKVIQTISDGKITSLGSNFIVLNGVSNTISTVNPYLISNTTFTSSKINFANTSTLTIQNRTVNAFNTFDQLLRFDGTIVGTFQQDEPVFQGNATGMLHSVVTGNTNSIFLVQPNGSFTSNTTITGNTSGATFNPNNKYTGFIKQNTGDILYIQNTLPVSRSSNKSEMIQIVLEN